MFEICTQLLSLSYLNLGKYLEPYTKFWSYSVTVSFSNDDLICCHYLTLTRYRCVRIWKTLWRWHFQRSLIHTEQCKGSSCLLERLFDSRICKTESLIITTYKIKLKYIHDSHPAPLLSLETNDFNYSFSNNKHEKSHNLT